MFSTSSSGIVTLSSSVLTTVVLIILVTGVVIGYALSVAGDHAIPSIAGCRTQYTIT